MWQQDQRARGVRVVCAMAEDGHSGKLRWSNWCRSAQSVGMLNSQVPGLGCWRRCGSFRRLSPTLLEALTPWSESALISNSHKFHYWQSARVVESRALAAVGKDNKAAEQDATKLGRKITQSFFSSFLLCVCHPKNKHKSKQFQRRC